MSDTPKPPDGKMWLDVLIESSPKDAIDERKAFFPLAAYACAELAELRATVERYKVLLYAAEAVGPPHGVMNWQRLGCKCPECKLATVVEEQRA